MISMKAKTGRWTQISDSLTDTILSYALPGKGMEKMTRDAAFRLPPQSNAPFYD